MCLDVEVQEPAHTAVPFTIHEDFPEMPRHLSDEHPRTVPSDHKSQSERDWAYAKRALARGDNPEVVIQRIADYRSEDKADPQYYARHTVAKAKEQLDNNDHHVQHEITEKIDLKH
jgi:hypothetical protein